MALAGIASAIAAISPQRAAAHGAAAPPNVKSASSMLRTHCESSCAAEPMRRFSRARRRPRCLRALAGATALVVQLGVDAASGEGGAALFDALGSGHRV